METTNTDAPAALESEVCTRCGGCGAYSHCQMYGSICFKCGGKGRTLTTRGAEAARYLNALRSRPASTIQAGEKIWHDGAGFTKSGWMVVEVVYVSPAQTFVSPFDGKTIHQSATIAIKMRGLTTHVGPDDMIRVGQSGADQAATFAKALAYQATLTKAGKPRKGAK